MSISTEEIKSLCADLLKIDVDAIEFPGGNSREAVRVRVGDLSFFVTNRKNLQRAKLESLVLRVLNESAAPVPHLIAYRDHFLIQQDVGSQRLSEHLSTGNTNQNAFMLESALESLYRVHQIGNASSRLDSLVVLGDKAQWLSAFVMSARRLGEALNMPAPTLENEKLISLLRVEQPRFIKWDARPGNAVVRDEGEVLWIDWEHCGRRHPLDDVAWLLTDEYTPDLDQEENALIARILPAFANGYSYEKAHEYLRVFGTFHSCMRISMILKHQSKGGWWDYQRCLELDRIGVVKVLAVRLCKRAAKWSVHSELTRDLSPWFLELSSKIAEL